MAEAESKNMNLRMVKCGKVNLKRDSENLLITGDGRSLLDDISTFYEMGIGHDTMCIGRSIKLPYTSPVKHWVNVDGPDSKWWAEHLPSGPEAPPSGVEPPLGWNPGQRPGSPIRHTIGECAGYDCIWDDGRPDGDPWYGSSALFAALIGLTLGYKAIVLAGCPLDKEGHWYFGPEHKGPEWREEDYQVWREFASLPKPATVTSLSGFTKEVLS